MIDLDAFVLCGGLGTRLRPAVGTLPKPIAPIAGRPFLDLLLGYGAAQGLRRFVLCAGYGAEEIAGLARGLGRHGEIVISAENRPLGTAGALRAGLAHGRSDTSVAMNGDSFAAVDLAALIAFHRERAARFTLAVVSAEQGEEGGAIRLDRDGAVRSFEEKRRLTSGDFLNAGHERSHSHRDMLLLRQRQNSLKSRRHDLMQPGMDIGFLP